METGSNAIKKFMAYIAAGLIIYIPVVCGIYLIIKRLSLAVFLGALYGAAVTFIYYLLFANAIKNAVGQDPDNVKKRIQTSYSLRMFFLVIAMGIGFVLDISLGILSWLPMLLAVLVPRIPILIYMAREKKRGKDSDD